MMSLQQKHKDEKIKKSNFRKKNGNNSIYLEFSIRVGGSFPT